MVFDNGGIPCLSPAKQALRAGLRERDCVAELSGVIENVRPSHDGLVKMRRLMRPVPRTSWPLIPQSAAKAAKMVGSTSFRVGLLRSTGWICVEVRASVDGVLLVMLTDMVVRTLNGTESRADWPLVHEYSLRVFVEGS